jgi:hypothetical protein
MNKPTNKKLATKDLVVDKALNVRLTDNYDLPTLMEQIREMGRIVKPLIVDGDTNKVLSGNRRALAAKALLDDPTTDQALAKELEKLECVVYTGLSEGERTKLIFDHGSEKAINRTETLLSVWRLDKQMFSEKQIASLMYFALAKYSGKESKLKDVPTEPQAREKFVHAWFRGTLGNYMLSAHRMGDYVREQMVKTHLSEDKLLKEGETVEMKCTRDRIIELSKAKSDDSGKDGKGWTVETGGEKFNALIEKFKAEDKGERVKEPTRPTAKALAGMADIYKSPAIRRALLVAAGDQSVDGKMLLEADEQLTDVNDKMASLAKHKDELKDNNLKEFISVLVNGNAADVEQMLQRLVK